MAVADESEIGEPIGGWPASAVARNIVNQILDQVPSLPVAERQRLNDPLDEWVTELLTAWTAPPDVSVALIRQVPEDDYTPDHLIVVKLVGTGTDHVSSLVVSDQRVPVVGWDGPLEPNVDYEVVGCILCWVCVVGQQSRQTTRRFRRAHAHIG